MVPSTRPMLTVSPIIERCVELPDSLVRWWHRPALAEDRHGIRELLRLARGLCDPALIDSHIPKGYIDAMQFLILGILIGGPLSLYDVHKRFAGGISLFYAASFGSIQRALRQLEAQGWAIATDAADSRRRKKLYVVTDAGRQAWRDWMRRPIAGSNAESTMLAKVYLLGRLPEDERAECLAQIRGRLVEDAAALTSLAADLDTAEVPDDARDVYGYRRATLDYGIRSHSLALQWLDEVERAA